jgi:hypothetical protein
MDQAIRHFITTNRIDDKVRTTEVYRFDFGSTSVTGRLINDRVYFNVDDDPDGTIYEKKAQRFYKCWDIKVRAHFFPTYTMNEEGQVVLDPESPQPDAVSTGDNPPELVTPEDDDDTDFVLQKDYKGNEEKLDSTVYTHFIECPLCGDTRWVKPSDVFQVRHCKPCTLKVRRQRKTQRKKAASTPSN